MKATGARIVARTPTFCGVLFDFVLAVEVRNARLSVGGADGSEDEMHACCLGRVGGGDTLSCLGVRTSGRRRHREERGRSFERLRDRRSVFERRRLVYPWSP